MIRRLSPLLVLVLLAASCAYESSGTTTTTTLALEDQPAATSPASLVVTDQRSEGSSLVIDSVTLPAAGWVVARADDAGSPGEIVGISELLARGTINQVPLPFLVPIAATTTVHLSIHIDVDRDGRFLYEPPDSFIDEIATTSAGDPAAATVEVSLLPPIAPGDAFLEEQVTDGTEVVVTSAVLPAPGFVVLQANEGGEPGAVLAVSELLPVGPVGEVVLAPVPALRVTGLVFAAAYVDRDESGTFTPGEDGDEMAVREDGSLALSSAVMTVLPLFPAELGVSDQETEGEAFVIEDAVVSALGFIEVLADDAGSPGQQLAVEEIAPGTHTDITIELPAGVTSGDTLWLRLWVDFDQDGVLGEGDLQALVEDGGEPVEVSFVITIVTGS